VSAASSPASVGNRPPIVGLEELTSLVPSGCRLGIGGFHFSRAPIAFIRAVVGRGVEGIEYVSWGGGLGLEMLLEAGAVSRMALCFNSLDVFGLAPRFRQAVEAGTVPLEEWTALGMIQGFQAAQHGVPSMPFPPPVGSEIVERSGFARPYPDPVTGPPVVAAPALPLDVFLLHAQRADEAGNVEIRGARGLDLSCAFAAKRVLVTVEEIVPAGFFPAGASPRSFVLPRSFVAAVAPAPFGAYPTSCLPHYPTDYRELLRLTGGDRLELRDPDPSGARSSRPRQQCRPSASRPRRCSAPDGRGRARRGDPGRSHGRVAVAAAGRRQHLFGRIGLAAGDGRLPPRQTNPRPRPGPDHVQRGPGRHRGAGRWR
jgi:acyl CoA:acetate/3-ketoacid CoA transferase alpha subunit